jgi:signal transduction histidine kinase
MLSGDTGAGSGFDLLMVTGSGESIPVAVAAAPILGPNGKLLGGVGVMRDLSSERELDEMKSALISTVSHELRTPLTMIQGFAELLNTRDLTEDRSREALRQIQVSAERLGRLIEELLSVSRIESGRLKLHPEPVDLSEVIQEVAGQLDPNGRVNLEMEAPMPEISGDRDKLIQIVSNLVSNALKYSEVDSEVRVMARREPTSVRLEVEDRGIGMTPEQMKMLFEKFHRADHPKVREAGGTGLGLFITKSLVEMHGGQIGAESSPEEGTTFWVTLPLDSAEKEDRHDEEAIDSRR